ncbi:hypothetical protein CI109_106442 [Kwoniella shandongensis]|uniref:Uncharacterized protein n=1 Tax=Kwoniella shandongensis TaxID=1734106 RepID=A0A5M6C161_9TREE|nr:uncharacterized protein CI109_002624 [Kwoniella shandongensis]KAA5528867.1 hypothetical protein CI109_002624 [Kwoniella shandongensis]
MSRISPARKDSGSNKGLPPPPLGSLGLDFSGRASIDGPDEFGSVHSKSSKPSPSHFVPLRDLHHSSPSLTSLNPTTPTTATSSSFSFFNTPTKGDQPSPFRPRMTHSPSLASIRTTGTASILNGDSVSTPTSATGKRIMFASTSMSASSIRSATKHQQDQVPFTPTGSVRKRSSGQLLSGIGKGLNRVGSVMRRNTAEGTTPSSTKSRLSRKTSIGKWNKDGKGKGEQRERKVTASPERQLGITGGDAGIGRPFNTEHELHVSPDLSDLPPAWLESLKAQGLSESDLKMITDARKRQQARRSLPRPEDPNVPRTPQSVSPTKGTSSAGNNGLLQSGWKSPLKKFSFEPESPTTPTAVDQDRLKHLRSAARDVFDAGYSPVVGGPSTIQAREFPRGNLDSYPASASESSDIDMEMDTRRDIRENVVITPRVSRRLSDQLRGFRESKFGLLEDGDDDWGRSILSVAWEEAGSSSIASDDDQAIPIIPLRSNEPPTPVSKPTTQETDLGRGDGGRDPSNRKLDKPAHSQALRNSSDSFGVHHTSLSKSTIDSQLVTPSTSTEHHVENGDGDGDSERVDSDEKVRTRSDFLDSPLTLNTATLIDPPSPAYSDLPTARYPPHHHHTHSESSPAALHRPSQNLTHYPSLPDMSHRDSDSDQGSFGPFPTPGSVPTSIAGSYEHLPLADHVASWSDSRNPHISFPTSAVGTSESLSSSRAVTPDPEPHAEDEEDPNHLSPNRTRSAGRRSFYSTSSHHHGTSPTPSEMLDGLDGANREERASIALSLLSSRASTDVHSLHELREATVRIAYKGMLFPKPTSQVGKKTTELKESYEMPEEGGERSSDDLKVKYEQGNHEEHENSGSRSYSPSTTSHGLRKEEDKLRAKDALDALGEAAMRIVVDAKDQQIEQRQV